MHETDSVPLSGSRITFCGKAFSLLGLHASWSSAGGGRSSLGTHAKNRYTCKSRAYMRSSKNSCAFSSLWLQ